MEHIEIKKIAANNLDELQKISRQTFYETFAGNNSEENMAKFLNEAYASEKLLAELEDEHTEFYFATSGGQVIGYLKLNFAQAQTELKDGNGLEIERIYVAKEFLGKSVGQMLYAKAMDVAKKAGCQYIWLGVWEENQRAIAFYKKNGFVAFDQHVFMLGDDRQIDIMMKLDLTRNEK